MVSESVLGSACALGAAVTWAVTSSLVRSLPPALSSGAINALRSSAGGGLLLLVLALSGGLSGLAAMSWRALALLAVSIVFAIVLGDTVFFDSTRTLGLGRAMTISMTYPLGAAVLAALLLGEPLTLKVAAGAVVTLAGLTVIVNPWSSAAGADGYWRGVGEATLASAAWAVSVVVVKVPLGEMDALTAQAVRLPTAAAILWLSPWGRGALAALPALGRPALARLGLLSVLTAGSSVMFVASVKYTDVAIAAVLSSTAPLFAIPLGWLVLGERLTPAAVAGALLTVAGIVILQAG